MEAYPASWYVRTIVFILRVTNPCCRGCPCYYCRAFRLLLPRRFRPESQVPKRRRKGGGNCSTRHKGHYGKDKAQLEASHSWPQRLPALRACSHPLLLQLLLRRPRQLPPNHRPGPRIQQHQRPRPHRPAIRGGIYPLRRCGLLLGQVWAPRFRDCWLLGHGRRRVPDSCHRRRHQQDEHSLSRHLVCRHGRVSLAHSQHYMASQQPRRRDKARHWNRRYRHPGAVQLISQQLHVSQEGRVSPISRSPDSYTDMISPFFVRGCSIGCALTFMITILSLGLHFKLDYENRKRDREFGSVEDHEQLDVTLMGDKHPKFRYLT